MSWFASRCIHSAACVRALPAVFDPSRRPWIDLGSADADAIARAVVKCPTGALQYERLDGGAAETVPDSVQVTPVRNGPYLIRGRVDIVDPATRQPHSETRVALCRCGQSKHMPYCDNTHRAIGFRSNP
ncbi:MAG: CDGSH iron-sulfur domain-containing protein [Gemmatimonadaceae bacterium]